MVRFRRSVIFTVAVVQILSAAEAAAEWRPERGVSVYRGRTNGRVSFIKPLRRGEAIPLGAPVGAGPALSAELRFLNQYGDLFGIRDARRELAHESARKDQYGGVRSSYQQVRDGVPVFTGVVRVHLSPQGDVRAANGDFYAIPDHFNTVPGISPGQAAAAAAFDFGGNIDADRVDLMIVDPGWYGDPPIGARLAYYVEIGEPSTGQRKAYFIDAHTSAILDGWSLLRDIRDREVYDSENTGQIPGTLRRTEGQPPVLEADVDKAYDYSGDTYDYFFRAFGFDSIDGAGIKLISNVRNTAVGCPNAFWNAGQSAYCPGLANDDIVGHEFVHGLTEYSANLVYQNQPGQLNESFSDVFGETIDLFNGNAAINGGATWPAHSSGPGRDQPNNPRSTCSNGSNTPNGVRWLIGEDGGGFGQAIRDMWQPSCKNDPDRANDNFYPCGGGDNGGVHTGSGVPNHAYAILCDGKSFNGYNVAPIGIIKAGAIWFYALTQYLTPASDFEDAYIAFIEAGGVLLGQPLNDPRTGQPSGQAITQSDLNELDEALRAVELNSPGACGATDDVLRSAPPIECDPAEELLFETFETGAPGWTTTRIDAADLADWVITTNPLPNGRAGAAFFCRNAGLSDCEITSDAGVRTLISPAINGPADTRGLTLSFVHLLKTEGGSDGGTLEYRIGNGPWSPVPRTAFLYNAYNGRLFTTQQSNDNPFQGREAFTGVGGGWGTSLVRLEGLIAPGQPFQLAWSFSTNICGADEGWFVDDVHIYRCGDCNDDGNFDRDEFRFSFASAVQGPIGTGSPLTFTYPNPPPAGGAVLLRINAFASFVASSYVDVSINGTFIHRFFDANGGLCQGTPDSDEFVINVEQFNTLVGDQPLNVTLTASPNVDTAGCGGASWAAIYVDYDRLTPDCNTNRLPDTCEADCNTNSTADACEIGLGPGPAVIPSDYCTAAPEICTGVTYVASTLGATKDGATSCSIGNAPDVWFAYTATESNELTFTLCGSNYDTVLSLHTACPSQVIGQVACNNDSSCGLQSKLTIIAASGTRYLIRVSGQSGDAGVFSLRLSGSACRRQGLSDCNTNGVLDLCEPECNSNGFPDECDVAEGGDCDTNGVPDACDLLTGVIDCDTNKTADACDLAAGAPDCDTNAIADRCDLRAGAVDCDTNTTPDRCDLSAGAADCNTNMVVDRCDVVAGAADCDTNAIPDLCDLAGGAADCNTNAVADRCDVLAGAADCDTNAKPDRCDLAEGAADCDSNQQLDACQPDSDGDGTINPCDGCPQNAAKTAPGVCGCAASDSDADGDGALDCVDDCPQNAALSESGICGCDATHEECASALGCPLDDVEVMATTAAGTVVSYALPRAPEPAARFIVTSSHPSGMTFPVGTTQVAFSVTDSQTGEQFSCGFQLTVQPLPPGNGNGNPPDEEPPPPAEQPPPQTTPGGLCGFLGGLGLLMFGAALGAGMLRIAGRAHRRLTRRRT